MQFISLSCGLSSVALTRLLEFSLVLSGDFNMEPPRKPNFKMLNNGKQKTALRGGLGKLQYIPQILYITTCTLHTDPCQFICAKGKHMEANRKDYKSAMQFSL